MASTEELDAVCRSLADLVAATPGPIRRIRLRSGDTEIEVDWPGSENAAAPEMGAVTAGELAANGTLATINALVASGALAANGGRAGLAAGAVQSLEDTSVYYVSAPMVGTFYRSPEPGAPPFVNEGDVVRPGQQVAILEAMKMMLPVEADRAGVLKAVLAADAGPVEYGERLFAISVAEA